MRHDMVRGLLARTYVADLAKAYRCNPGRGESLWPYLPNESNVQTCPICGSPDIRLELECGRRVRWLCGGLWVKTVDQFGEPCWEGFCGKPLPQKMLAFTEEEA
jgi:hypothetical protein